MLVLNVIRLNRCQALPQDQNVCEERNTFADENVPAGNSSNNSLLIQNSVKHNCDTKFTPISNTPTLAFNQHQRSKHCVTSQRSSKSHRLQRAVNETTYSDDHEDRKRSKRSQTSCDPSIKSPTPPNVRTDLSQTKSMSTNSDSLEKSCTVDIAPFGISKQCSRDLYVPSNSVMNCTRIFRLPVIEKSISHTSKSLKVQRFASKCDSIAPEDLTDNSTDNFNVSNAHNRAFIKATKRTGAHLDVTRWDPYLSIIQKSDSMILQHAQILHSVDVTWSPCSRARSDASSSAGERVQDRSSDYFSYSSDSLHETCKTADRCFLVEHSWSSDSYRQMSIRQRNTELSCTRLPVIMVCLLYVFSSLLLVNFFRFLLLSGLVVLWMHAGLPSKDRRFKPVHGYFATPFSNEI